MPHRFLSKKMHEEMLSPESTLVFVVFCGSNMASAPSCREMRRLSRARARGRHIPASQEAAEVICRV
jgi:hypothetical protein